MDKEKNTLNKEEKKEIVTDVKAAFEKARKSSNINYKEILTEKNSKSITFITIIIILIIACTGIYWYLANNPKTIFKRSSDVVFENIESSIKTPSNDLIKGTIDINYDLKPINYYNDLNKYDFKIKYTFDSLNNISSNKITTNYENNQLSEINIYNDKTNLYLYSNDLSENYIHLDNRKTIFIYDTKNVKALFKSLNTVFNNSLDGQKFSGSKVDLSINNKNVKAYQVSLTLDKENKNVVLDNINNLLKEDTRFKSSYSKIFNIDEENVINEINSCISNLKYKYQNTKSLTINIYTKGVEREFVKLEIIENKNDVLNTISLTKLGKNKYTYINESKTENKKTEAIISIKQKEDKTTYNLSLTKTNGNIKTLEGTFKIKVTENIGSTIKQIKTDNLTKYSELAIENQNDINKKLDPLETLINVIKNK